MSSFWNTLPKPIVGLSAMDGVTDAAMREITARVGKPDFMVTEFTSAEGVIRGVTRILRDFYFTPSQRPIVAQIFGTDPDSFRRCAIICCFLGFDGIDINMGCPADSIAHKGGGASLIKNPALAKAIIRAVQKGVQEFTNGIELAQVDLPASFIELIKQRAHRADTDRAARPVSVKTRIGYDKPVIEEWIPHLLETEPALITLHGRTLEQQYGGQANWEEIAKAAMLVHQTNTLIFGNGDLTTPQQIEQKVQESGVDGVWIGRAAMGNPWIFSQYHDYISGKEVEEVTTQERFRVALEHCSIFEEFNRTVFRDDPIPFLNMRKHLGWYIKGFPNATDIRLKLFQTNSSLEVAAILNSLSP